MVSPKRKILYLVTSAERGGAQRYIRDLALALDARQYLVAVAAGGRGGLLEDLQARGIRTYPLQHLRREISPWHDVVAIREITRLCATLEPDVLHLNSSKAGVLGAVAAQRLKIPLVVYTAHGFVFTEPLAAWRRWLYRELERSSARRIDRIICVAEADHQSALAYRIAPEKKLITIHNGIAVDALNFLTRDQARHRLATHYHLPTTDYQLIGTIANLYPTKGLETLLTAAAAIMPKRPDTHVIIIGHGRERQHLQAVIRHLGLADRCHLVGGIPNAAGLLPAFTLYVNSSTKEGFPYSVLDAMAAGLPIVATAVGGVPEMIRDGQEGRLVPAGDGAQLAAAMVELLVNPARAEQFGHAARRRVRLEFTLQRMIEQTLACYQ